MARMSAEAFDSIAETQSCRITTNWSINQSFKSINEQIDQLYDESFN